MSRSPEKLASESETRSPIAERRMSIDSPEVDEAPAKRMRMVDRRGEDKARGKRLFGNILGTLQKFQKDDKVGRTSEAAKRREEVAERIASKLRSETTLHNDIAETERELKALRISTESAEYILKHKEVALEARHAALKPMSKFLHTSLPYPQPLVFEANLLNPSPIPLAKGPAREPPPTNQLRPLYFMPKILTHNQETALESRIANISELIASEVRDLEKEKENIASTSVTNRARIEELVSKLADLKGQLPRGSKRPRERDVDELGRTRREDLDMDLDRDREREKDRSPSRGDGSGMDVEVEERGVQIKGDDGDVEVEY